VTVGLPDSGSRWRCAQCGNLTRFDVVRTSRQREFWHLDLAGSPSVEQTETLSETLDSVTCRWCGAGAVVEIVARPDGGTS